jgi:putative Holliday junction resolvase
LLALGFDFGLRRIGVAVGSTTSGRARALQTIGARDGAPDKQTLDALVQEWQPDRLVVGLPYNVDGSDSESTRAARRFAGLLQDRYRISVIMVDERLSSRDAQSRLREQRRSGLRRRRVRRSDIDREAAAVILQDWLETQQKPKDPT